MSTFLILILIGRLMISSAGHSTTQPNMCSAFYELCNSDQQSAGLPACTNEERELFVEVEEAESMLIDEMARNIPTPPSPAHPKFQKFYLDQQQVIVGDMKKEAAISSAEEKPKKSNSKPWARIRSMLLGKAALRAQARRIVKCYQDQLKSGQHRGVLLQKLYADLLITKQYGQVDPAEFRQKCHETMTLLAEEHKDIDVALIHPYPDLLSLMRDSGRIFLALFKKQKLSSKSQKGSYAENMIRILKSVVEEKGFFNRMVLNNGTDGDQKGRQRRRKRMVVLVGVIAFVGILMIATLLFVGS